MKMLLLVDTNHQSVKAKGHSHTTKPQQNNHLDLLPNRHLQRTGKPDWKGENCGICYGPDDRIGNDNTRLAEACCVRYFGL